MPNGPASRTPPSPSELYRPPQATHDTREILDAVFFYVLRSGCAWRLLPHDFPPWKTVHHYYFRIWRIDGTWERLNGALRERLRARIGRNAQPSAGMVDSQSVKATGVGGERGYDGGKKIKGRKCHLLVDTQGLVLKAKVHAASVMDRDGIKPLLGQVWELFQRLSHLWLDAGYNGKDKGKDWVEKVLGLTAEIVRHPPSTPLRLGQGGRGAGLGKAQGVVAQARLQDATETLGGEADVFVDRSEPQDELRGTTNACRRAARRSSTWR